MRSDRYTKVVLTVIAVGLWALTMTQLGMPTVLAASGEPAAFAAEVPAGGAELEAAVPGFAGPLRWTVGYAAAWDVEATGGNECTTAVTLLSSAPSAVSVDVLFINKSGSTVGTASFSLAPDDPHSVMAHEGGGNTWPLEADSYPSTGFFTGGFARVYADDPRVLATAFLMCKESAADGVSSNGQKVLSVANIPAYPVGATADYFQAGMPATWTPPMVEPEVPE
jgi:hypothetical protein